MKNIGKIGYRGAIGISDPLYPDTQPGFFGRIRDSAGRYSVAAPLLLYAAGCSDSPPQSPTYPSPDPVPCTVNCNPPGNPSGQSQVSGYMRRILHGDGGNSVVKFTGNEKTFTANAGADGKYSSNVDNGVTYTMEVTGDHRGATFLNLSVNQPVVLDAWMVDNDNPNTGSPMHFVYNVFLNEAYPSSRTGLVRRDNNIHLRIWKANWTDGIIYKDDLSGPATENEIFDTLEKAARTGVSKLACGRLKCLNIEDVTYMNGVRDFNEPVPAGGMDFWATLDTKSAPCGSFPDYVACTWTTDISNREVLGGKTAFTPKKISTLNVLGLTVYHEVGRQTGMQTVNSAKSVMNVGFANPIQQIDVNNGTVAYSLPLGFSDSNGTGKVSQPSYSQPPYSILQNSGK